MLSTVLPPSAQAKESRVARVAARICPPFVMNDNGQYSGISIFLLENIARQLDVKYNIQQYELNEMLEVVSKGEADIAVSCLSITQEREEIVDFSHSFYETHLAIAVKQRGFTQILQGFFTNTRLYIVLGIVFGVAALIGGIFYLLEHGVNEKLYSMKNRGGRLLEAFITGLLFITTGPIRYYEFKSMISRTLAAFLAVGSTVMITSMTALLASTFTIDHMQSKISGPQDLAGVRVGVMAASTSFHYLQDQGIYSQTFTTREKLLAALDDGSLDAIVGDDAVLKYKIKNAQKNGKYEKLSVLPFVFEKQNYAFALPDDSPQLELFNQMLLAVRNTPEWKAELVKYIGN